jgi:hypothetical protein
LNGTIPTEFGFLVNVKDFVLGTKTDSIRELVEASAANALSLFFFDLMIDENQLYGPLPAELGLMTAVEELDVSKYSDHRNTLLLPISFL